MNKKIIAATLAFTTALASTFPAMAAEQTASPDSTANTDVYVTVEGEAIVWLPSNIIVSGTPDANKQYSGQGKVMVQGDIPGDTEISVVPDEKIYLSQEGKDDIAALVNQEKTVFTYSDLKNETTASTATKVSTTTLTAGEWNSILNYNISVNKIAYKTTQLSDWEYTIKNNSVVLTNYTGSDVNIAIPATFTDENGTVYSTQYNYKALQGNATIKNVYFEDGIKIDSSWTLLSSAFKNCTNLRTVKGSVPTGAQSAESLFEGCTNLVEYFDLSGMKGSAFRTFYKCTSLETITSVPSAGNNTIFSYFDYGCSSLKTIACHIPASATRFLHAFNNPTLTGTIVFDGTERSTQDDAADGVRSNYCNMFMSFYTNGLTVRATKDSDMYNALRDCATNNSTLTVQDLDGNTANVNIYCVGDSITVGEGSSTVTYPTELNRLLGSNYQARNFADGGMKIEQMSCRLGSTPVSTTTTVTIPQTTTPVTLTLDNNFDSKYIFSDASFTSKRMGVVTLGGIKGYLTWVGNKQYSFTRCTPGTSKMIPAGTTLQTYMSNSIKTNDIVVLTVGANDLITDYSNQTTINHIIETTRTMVDSLPTDKYIIALYGGYQNPSASDMVAFEEQMTNEFGSEKVISVRKALNENGLTDNELTATDDDNTTIANGQIPASLMSSDNIHLNTYGYKSLAKAIQNKINQLNY